MKTRLGFVSNSSSASFILQKSKMSAEQIEAILNIGEEDNKDGWSIYDDDEFIRGSTMMDNDAMAEFFRKINLGYAAIVDYSSEG